MIDDLQQGKEARGDNSTSAFGRLAVDNGDAFLILVEIFKNRFADFHDFLEWWAWISNKSIICDLATQINYSHIKSDSLLGY